MSDVPDFVKPTVEAFAGLFEKPSVPTMTKLFKRPPLKFIHDIVTSTLAATGFPQGLFADEHLDPANVADRDVKIWFVSKLVAVTSAASRRKFPVKPEKVVAGKEVERTNEFLREFALSAHNAQSLDIPRLVQQVNQEYGLRPGEPTQSNQDEENARRKADEKAEQQGRREARAEQERKRQEEEKRRREAQQQQQQTRPPQAQLPQESTADELSAVEWVAGTQAALGPLISKPKLAEKLLSKPPFRFLHDVVMNVFESNNIGDGLFDERLSNAKAIKTKEDKIEFLERLIQFLNTALNTRIETQPRKVIAGKDPESTNMMLQELARAVQIGVNTRSVLANMGNQGTAPPPEPQAHAPSHRQRAQEQPREDRRAQHHSREHAEHPQDTLRPVESHHRERPKSPKPNVPAIPIQKIQKPAISAEEKLYAPPAPKKTHNRPRTARRAPPSVKDTHIQEAPQEDVPNTESTTTGIIMESEAAAEDSESEKEEEDEAVRMQGFSGGAGQNLDPHEQGKLVRDILKTQQQAGIKFQRVPSSRNASASKWYSRQQIDELRSQIQKLCQSVNPLGKCMDFVSDDVQQMTRELEFWKKSYEQECKRLAQEQRRTDEQLAPHYERLAKLEAELASTQRDIHGVKATIMRNEEQVRKLVDATVSE